VTRPPTITHRSEKSIAVVLDLTDEAIGSGDRQGDLRGVARVQRGNE
jgi:hypothetical protein